MNHVVWHNLRLRGASTPVHKAVGPMKTACGIDGRSALVTTGMEVTCQRCKKFSAPAGGELRTVLSTASEG